MIEEEKTKDSALGSWQDNLKARQKEHTSEHNAAETERLLSFNKDTTVVVSSDDVPTDRA